MKKTLAIIATAAFGLVLASCSSIEKMNEMAENVTVTCEPAVLEVVAGSIDATVTVTYPADYFNPKALLEVTPVLVYEGGTAKAEVLKYQGQKIQDNYTVISKDGQTVTEKIHFDYVEGMEVATLELRATAYNKKKTKSVNLPVKKIADGCNTTYMLVKMEDPIPFKKDAYQEVIPTKAEGQIHYALNSSEVTNKELKGASLEAFKNDIDALKANERVTITGTQIIAAASPEGGQELNTKLSDNRAGTASKAWTKVVKGKNLADPTVSSTGQDWEGFQSLVSESNIDDKDLILRVLSMYSDPAVRESEIRNMSQVFTELQDGVLPELRRSRLIVNGEYQNYTRAELVKLSDENPDALDVEALLRAAANTGKTDKKIALYKKAIEKSEAGDDRAQFNLGAAYILAGDNKAAADAFAKCTTKDAELENALGVVAYNNGDLEAAKKHFAASGTDAAKQNNAVIDILEGRYDAAVATLKTQNGCTHNLALAYILTNDLASAEALLKDAKCPHKSYLKAIIAARQGKAEDVKKYLEVANKIPSQKARAEKDIEFADYR